MDTTVVDESCEEEPEITFDVTEESERHEDAEQVLAPTDTATQDLAIPNENPRTVTDTDPDLGTFVGVSDDAVGISKENCLDSVEARIATLAMTFWEPRIPDEVLQSVEEDDTHRELTQLVPITALGE